MVKSGQGSALTVGLARLLVVILAVVILICAGTFIAVRLLDDQIERWSQIEEIDTLREELLGKVQLENATPPDPVRAAHSLQLFEDLARAVAEMAQLSGVTNFSVDAGRLVAEARERYLAVEDMRSVITSRRANLKSGKTTLHGILADWRRTLRVTIEKEASKTDAIEARIRFLQSQKDDLVSAMLATQKIRRAIASAGRFASLTSQGLTGAITDALTDERLPTLCDVSRIESVGRVCSPKVDRVRATLTALSDPDNAGRDDVINEAIWALDGYLRAAETRFNGLAAEMNVVLDEAKPIRAQTISLQRLDSALARMDQQLLGITESINAAQYGNLDVTTADQQVRFAMTQLRLRIAGFLKQTPQIPEGKSLDLLAGARANWLPMKSALIERHELISSFDSLMTELAATIAQKTAHEREKATGHVNLFASIAVAAAALLAVIVFFSAWLAQMRLILPLSQVTNAIHALARGETKVPHVARQTALGFDRLADALDMLKVAIAERSALATRNEDQKHQIQQNLSKLKKVNQEMEWLAMHDPLTGLGNRRHADAALARLTERGQETQSDFCLIHLDVDRFKEINDTIGHKGGDYVLCEVADLLKECSSVATSCYRIGGDEFLITFDGWESKQDIFEFAKRINEELARPFRFEGYQYRVSTSMGIAFGVDAEFDANTALANADLALYEAKRFGRNQYKIFTEKMEKNSRAKKNLSDQIQEAIENKEFVPFYQPQYNTHDLTISGVETLCRWYRPERGWISPGEFLPVAEELGLIGRIDEILLEKSGEDLSRLQSMGLSVPKISFNLTADRLLQSHLPDQLRSTIPPDTFVAVELLESMSLDNLSQAMDWAVEALKDRGIFIEIDDFGSCRASIAGLISVGPQAMKIDRSIIMPLTHSPTHLKLVKAIIEIGRSLDISVVAEGVETETHIETLCELGCDVLQGFALARPMPINDLAKLLQQKSMLKNSVAA